MGVHVDAMAPRRMGASGSAGGGISPSPPRRASPGRAPAVMAPAGQGARTAAGGGVGRSPESQRRASPSRAAPAVAVEPPAVEGPRRRVSFSGGESLWNDELMRRFVLAQEGPPRRGEMEMATRHRRRKWRAPGESRLRRMSLAHVAADQDGETNDNHYE
ncbi:hypothetical protein E2562_018804 [Oryza meyeriana var. granulata]|uniref:Uncharacterized protein n=1 Tax=Oryza meyeriana var. granulata TaxID=110450 RepID=A0A6G1F9G4_9ORYZ|nr:hypothetical protein E2562_018804 [Oryza meyeriana var. granulata]